jgi:hypothetical protein
LKTIQPVAMNGKRESIDTRWLIQPSFCIFAVAFGLGWRVSQLQLIAPMTLVEFALLAAAPLCAVAAWLDRSYVLKGSPGPVVILLAASVAWAAGTLGETNMVFDHAPARNFVSRLEAKRIVHHRRNPDSYRLTIAPLPGTSKPISSDVSAAFYAQLVEGEAMCVSQHPGALGFAWFEERACPTTAPATQPSAPPNRSVHSAT